VTDHGRKIILGRMFVVLGLALLIPGAILVQLIRINVIEGDRLRELWNTQTIQYIPIPAQRGAIYASGGSQLAANSVIYRVAVDPYAPGATMDHFSELTNILSRHTGKSASGYLNRIRNSSGSRYIVLERTVPVAAYEEIQMLGARGIILEEEHRRTYAFGSLGAHVLGFVNRDLRGVTGLEATYNRILGGEDGLQQVRRDRSNRIFSYVGAPRKLPEQGHSLHTTIDAYIQAIAEEELRAGISRTRSNYGTAIIMDPRTGAIKAMANYPDFDPNRPASDENENRRNYAISDMVEPGSTFKLVTAVAAVEQGVVDFDEIFETPEDGRRLIYGQMMRDHDPLGDLDFTQAVAKSSNIAISEIAMRLKPQVFYQYARNFGFGTRTEIDLPNEEDGRLQRPYEWSKVTLPWLSIGYEVQATPLQVLQAYAAFANNGVMMRPYVVDRVTNEFGETVRINRPSRVRRVMKEETVEKLLPVFQEVVSDSGTASWAMVEGLEIAGKTGTAQKYIDGRYRTAYRATFAGFFPVEDPQYAMIVMLDEPKTSYYGGFTAGQVFREMARRIAGLDSDIRRSLTPSEEGGPDHYALMPRLEGLKKEQAMKLLAELGIDYSEDGSGAAVITQVPTAGDTLITGQRARLVLGELQEDPGSETHVAIPDLRGMSMRQATSILYEIGLEPELIGSGTIYSQFPRAGELMQKGRAVTLRGRIREFSPPAVLTNLKQ